MGEPVGLWCRKGHFMDPDEDRGDWAQCEPVGLVSAQVADAGDPSRGCREGCQRSERGRQLAGMREVEVDPRKR